MSNSIVLLFVMIWTGIAILNTNVKHNKVVSAIQDNGCTIPHEILDPILDKIVKEQTE